MTTEQALGALTTFVAGCVAPVIAAWLLKLTEKLSRSGDGQPWKYPAMAVALAVASNWWAFYWASDPPRFGDLYNVSGAVVVSVMALAMVMSRFMK